MKEYDIEVKEILTRVVSVEANNIEEAIDNVVDMYNREEIVLDYDDFGERIFENLYSKKIDTPFNINIDFKDGILTIHQDNNQKEVYSCDKIRNIGSCLNSYLNEYMEDHNIDSKEGHQIEIELNNLEEELEK